MLPPELKKRPFTLDEARLAGLTRRALAGKSWRRIGSSLYCWVGLQPDVWQLLQAGFTAAWLHRLDVDALQAVEVAVSTASGMRSRPGLVVHRYDLQRVVTVRGLPVTAIERTFGDLKRRLPRVEFLVLADQALRLDLGRFDELAERAESPMETRLRWTLIQAGLPRPQVQARLSFGRADLYYPQARLVIEYDGQNHRERLSEDNRRQNLLLSAGYRLLRFTASDRPEVITAQVRTMLLA